MTRTFTLQLAALAAIAIAPSGCQTLSKASAPPVAGAQLGNRPVDVNLAQRGVTVWRDRGCFSCHGFGRVLAGPDLAGVMERRDNAWLRRWLKNTTEMLQADPQAVAMLKDWNGVKMPNFNLNDADITALFHYLAQETARVRGSGS